jgi:hypothetical protein
MFPGMVTMFSMDTSREFGSCLQRLQTSLDNDALPERSMGPLASPEGEVQDPEVLMSNTWAPPLVCHGISYPLIDPGNSSSSLSGLCLSSTIVAASGSTA